jgi:fibronectin type 3 domain-containing protein
MSIPRPVVLTRPFLPAVLSLVIGASLIAAPGAAPGQLVATPGNGRVTLTWSPVAGATGYRIYRATNGVFGQTPLRSTSATSYTNTGLVNGATYSYKVAAYDATGTGPQSAAVSAVPLAPPRVIRQRRR